MKKENKQKQPKKKRTFFGIASKAFLILAILFFLLAVVGIADGVISVFVFCVLCGLACLYVSRLLKKNDKINERIAAQDAALAAEIKETVVAAKAEDRAATVSAAADMVDVLFPDGHIEQRRTWMTIDEDEGCLISENGRTYHTDFGCFYNWSEEYQATFTGWQLISVSEARRRGLRKCKFCIENDKW